MGKTIVSSKAAARFGPVVLAVASAILCTVINPARQADDWASIQSIATGLAFGVALAACEALWGRRRWVLVALIPVATLIGWIAAWWTTLYAGSYAGELLGPVLGESKEVFSQIIGGIAGGAVGAALTALSLSALRNRVRLACATAIGAILGATLVVDLQFDWQVLYFVWQIGFALYLGRCLALEYQNQPA